MALAPPYVLEKGLYWTFFFLVGGGSYFYSDMGWVS